MASTDLLTAVESRAKQLFALRARQDRPGKLPTREARVDYFKALWQECMDEAEAELGWWNLSGTKAPD